MPDEEQPSIRAVEMVREIRDRLNEEIGHLAPEELPAYFAQKAAKNRQELQQQPK